jgi:hypothetical protein
MLSLRTITGYAFSTIEPQVFVRKATAYALVRTPISTTIRKAAVYALSKSPVPLIKGKTSLEQLYTLINGASIGTVFTPSNLNITTLIAEQYQGYNTKVKVAATSLTIGYSGSAFLRYNRTAISRSFEDTTELGFVIAADTTIHGILDQLNTTHNLKLVPGDVVDGPLRGGAKTVLLTATETSYLYAPGTTIQLGSPYQELSDIITVTDLPGFERVMFELDDIITVVDLPGFEPVTV